MVLVATLRACASFGLATIAWELYGWPTALGVFVGVDVALVFLGWAALLWTWSFRWHVRARTALVILSYVLISLSSAR